jgi:hypothetical protein
MYKASNHLVTYVCMWGGGTYYALCNGVTKVEPNVNSSWGASTTES